MAANKSAGGATRKTAKSAASSALSQRAKKTKSGMKSAGTAVKKSGRAKSAAGSGRLGNSLVVEQIDPRVARFETARVGGTALLSGPLLVSQMKSERVAFGPISTSTYYVEPSPALAPPTPDVADQLWALLRSADETTVNTSMRIPASLRDAARLAVKELGTADSTTALTADALRTMLESVAIGAALEAHYADHPDARPSLAQVAIAAAIVDRHPLAAHPEIIEAAANQIVVRHPDADADDVLLWAEALHQVRA